MSEAPFGEGAMRPARRACERDKAPAWDRVPGAAPTTRWSRRKKRRPSGLKKPVPAKHSRRGPAVNCGRNDGPAASMPGPGSGLPAGATEINRDQCRYPWRGRLSEIRWRLSQCIPALRALTEEKVPRSSLLFISLKQWPQFEFQSSPRIAKYCKSDAKNQAQSNIFHYIF
ncbi:hypothetical protein J2W27_000463 [Variovorax boronicumulans]|uniref:hypothetical protein n=1 Tax=Variovorax boronicumulans TaxID=436515 RepID=UPI00278091C1|nr:hypothetical protein [Variovorax boronicumulans]MDP9908370.1 hypothetical protein [Variovorax boronicumulans]